MNWPPLERWSSLVRSVGAVQDGSEWYARLTEAYRETHRFYHNQLHIAECLAEFDSTRALAIEPEAVELALWFHDAVYQPKNSNNEEESVDLARRALSEVGIPKTLSASVRSCIMATKMHSNSGHPDAALVVDIDLCIFGKEPGRFLEYEKQIQSEYSWVPPLTFAEKRAEILEGFLARARIFTFERFYRRYENQARLNLAQSIAKLRAACL